MRACTDMAELERDPIGRCLAGPCWLYYWPREDLAGFAMWGAPDASAVERLVRALAVELSRAPHASLVDVRFVTSVEPAAFERLGAYVREHHEALARVVTKLALVRSKSGVMGAVASGFYDLAGAPYPVATFEDPVPALAWLGVDPALGEAIGEARDRAMGAPAFLRDLRTWLDGHLVDAAVDDAARALGQSTRSLQRRLAREKTSFQAEHHAARIRAAERWLRDTDASITRVALEVGFSPAHFGATFRAATGLTPSVWRARRR